MSARVLQHLLETLEKAPVEVLIAPAPVIVAKLAMCRGDEFDEFDEFDESRVGF